MKKRCYDQFKDINFYNFEYIHDENNKNTFGLIAQDLQQYDQFEQCIQNHDNRLNLDTT